MPLDPATKARLESISTATVTTLLLKKGLRNVWMRGPLPLTASARGKRLVGYWWWELDRVPRAWLPMQRPSSTVKPMVAACA